MLDIGRAIDYYDRFEHAAMIVRAADLAGFSHADLGAFMAILRQADHDTRPGPYARLVDEADRQAVERAAATLPWRTSSTGGPARVGRTAQQQLAPRRLRGRRARALRLEARGVADRFSRVFGKALLVVANESVAALVRRLTATSIPAGGWHDDAQRLHLGRHGGHRGDHDAPADGPWHRRLRVGPGDDDRGGERGDRGRLRRGAEAVVVSDSHGDMGNLLPDLVDPRAELVQGTPKLPWSMMAGIDETFGVAVFIGYHAAPAHRTRSWTTRTRLVHRRRARERRPGTRPT